MLSAFLVAACQPPNLTPAHHQLAEEEYHQAAQLDRVGGSAVTERLVRLLASSWPVVRGRAADALGRWAGPEAVRPLAMRLLQELEPESPDTRARLAYALRSFGTDDLATEALQKAADDSDEEVRAAVAVAVGYHGATMTNGEELLLRLARDESGLVQREAILAAARWQELSAVSAWQEIFVSAADPRARWAFYYLLAHGPRSILQSVSEVELETATDDPHFLVSCLAYAALERAGILWTTRSHTSLERLFGDDGRRFWLIRTAALERLSTALEEGLVTPRHQSSLGDMLLARVDEASFIEEPFCFQKQLLRTLDLLAPHVVRARLPGWLESWPKSLRVSLASTASGARLTEDLVSGLDPEDRAQVLAAGVRSGHVLSPPITMSADAHPVVRRAFLEAGDVLTITVLEQALEDADAQVRRAVLEKLRRRRTQVAPERLQQILQSSVSTWPERLLALDLLSALPKQIAALTAASLDPEPVVARHALRLATAVNGTVKPWPSELLLLLDSPWPFPEVALNLVRPRVPPRVRLRVAKRGDFAVVLDVRNAPQHTASFLALVRSGYFLSRAVGRVDCDDGVFLPDPGDTSPWTVPIAVSTSARSVNRGALVAVTRYASEAVGAPSFDGVGAMRLLLVPRPDLQGRATVCGHVLFGMEVVDRLAPGDRIVHAEVVQ